MTEPPDLPADEDIWTASAPPRPARRSALQQDGQPVLVPSPLEQPAPRSAEPPSGVEADEADEAVAADPSARMERRWPLRLGVAALAVACLALGFVVGSLRSTTDLDRGSSPTTSLVTAPAGGATIPASDTTAATTAPPGDPADPGEESSPGAPTMPTITQGIGFDDGIPTSVGPATVTTSPGWSVVDEHAVPPADDPLPDDAPGPRLPGEGPQLAVDLGAPVGVATVRLVTPTAHSGISVTTAAGGAWLLTVAPDLDELRVFEVRDGVAEQRAFLQQALPPDTSIGLYAAPGGVGVVVDGEPVQVETFFGTSAVVEGDGSLGTTLALVVGSGSPAFDDVAFG